MNTCFYLQINIYIYFSSFKFIYKVRVLEVLENNHNNFSHIESIEYNTGLVYITSHFPRPRDFLVKVIHSQPPT